MAKIQNSVVSYLNQLERTMNTTYYLPYDAYAMAVALNGSVALSSRRVYGFVESASQRMKGALVVDHLNVTATAANLDVVVGLDIPLLKKIMFDNFSNFK